MSMNGTFFVFTKIISLSEVVNARNCLEVKAAFMSPDGSSAGCPMRGYRA